MSSTPALVAKLDSLHPKVGLFLLILAQLVMGLGSGTLGVTRGYVADITPRNERTSWIGYLTAVQYAGFTVMPGVGALLCRSVKTGGE